MKKCYILIFLLLINIINAQETVTQLATGFRDIVIGLNMEDVKSALSNDGYFDYRGDPDVTMLLSENRYLIESNGNSYIKRGYFQFFEDTLYTITLVLNSEKMDFSTMFTTLTNKYGKHNSLTPSIITWENDKVRMTLEKPLTLKYVGLNIYNKIIENDTTEKAFQEKLMEDFLGEL